jgi:PIN domain
VSGLILDTGALIALETPGKGRGLTAALDRMGADGRVVISAGCLAEAWRGAPRQARLAKLLRRRSTVVEEITTPVAKAIGAFLGRYPNADDIVDAHVVMLANLHRMKVATSDPKDLLAIDPSLSIIQI